MRDPDPDNENVPETAPVRTFVVNLFGGPGTGKSTTAAGLFAYLKARGVLCELVTEYAKDLTWARDAEGLRDSLDLLAQQSARQRRLVGKVEFIITDSPLPLILCFAAKYELELYQTGWFDNAVLGCFSQYNNLNVLLRRVKPYSPVGRNQTEQEALDLDKAVRQLPLLWTREQVADERTADTLGEWLISIRTDLAQAIRNAHWATIFSSSPGYVEDAPDSPGEGG